MKATAMFIAAAMVFMVLEGCAYSPGTETYGQKIDRALDKTGTTLVAVGDSLTVKQADTDQMIVLAAAALVDTAWIDTSGLVDVTITSSIKSDLQRNPDTGGASIEVETRDGVVLLKGLAPSDSTRMQAEQIARAGKGVTRVENQLVVVEALSL